MPPGFRSKAILSQKNLRYCSKEFSRISLFKKDYDECENIFSSFLLDFSLKKFGDVKQIMIKINDLMEDVEILKNCRFTDMDLPPAQPSDMLEFRKRISVNQYISGL